MGDGSNWSRRRFLTAAGASAAGLWVLGGCGNDDTGSAPGGDAGDGGDGGVGYRGDVAVAHLAASPTAAALIIAERRGFYEDEGLDLEHVSFSGGSETVRGITTAGMNLGLPAVLPTVVAFARASDDLRIVGGVFNRPSVVFLVPAGSPIESPSDLEGRKIAATPGSISTYFATRMVEAADLSTDAVELVDAGGLPDAWTAADQGVVDVAWSAPPLSTRLIDSGAARLLQDTNDLVPAWFDNALVSTQSFVDSNRPVVEAWLRAVQRSLALIRDDPKAAAEAWSASVDLDPDLAEAVLSEHTDAWSLRVDPAGVEANAQAAVELGNLDEVPDTDQLVFDELIPGE